MTIPLSEDPAANEAAFKQQFAGRVDVVLDYLWGPTAERLLAAAANAGPDAVPVRFVQIGTMSGPDITLPGAALRSKAIELMGSGIGSVAFDRLLKVVADLLVATVPAGLKIETESVPLADVERTWNLPGDGSRVVFRVG